MISWKAGVISTLLLLCTWHESAASLPDVVQGFEDIQVTAADKACLANVVWREARGEPQKGRRAVVDVVMWRAATNGTASVCQVVKAPGQFSWMRRKGLIVPTQAMQSLLRDTLEHPQVIHNPWMQYFFAGATIPAWMRNPQCVKIFRHSFCALKGSKSA